MELRPNACVKELLPRKLGAALLLCPEFRAQTTAQNPPLLLGNEPSAAHSEGYKIIKKLGAIAPSCLNSSWRKCRKARLI